MKIAVATTDGININEHFGRADRFLIFEMTETGPSLLEKRSVTPLSEGDKSHQFNPDRFAQAAAALDGCERVYCERIGDRPAEELKKIGVEAIMMSGAIRDIK